MSEAGPSTVKKAVRKIDRAKSSKSAGARGVKKTRNADELVELEQALASYVRRPSSPRRLTAGSHRSLADASWG